MSKVEQRREEDITPKEAHVMAVRAVGYMHSEDPAEHETGWMLAEALYERYSAFIKSNILSPKKVKVDLGVWQSTIDKVGWDDLVGEARIIFFEALKDFDPDEGTYFSQYIKNKMSYKIFNYLRDGSSFDDALKATESFEEMLTEDRDEHGGGISKALYTEVMAENDRFQQDIDSSLIEDSKPKSNRELAVRVAWNSLSDKQKKVLDLMINKEYTMREAGREINVHFTTIRDIKKVALKKMQKIIKKVVEKDNISLQG